MENKAEYSWFIKEHINHFTLKTLRVMLQKAGFVEPGFHQCGYFALEKEGAERIIAVENTFAAVARKTIAHLLETPAQQKLNKPLDQFTDAELVEALSQQTVQWGLPPGEYALTHAVYVSAIKPDR